MNTPVYFPTNSVGFKTVGFLEKADAEKWIEEYVIEPMRKQWHVTSERFFASYAEYKEYVL